MKSRTASTILAIGLAAPLLFAQQKPTAPFNDSIRHQRMRPDIQFLCSDHLKGRLTGTPEISLAAEYIATRFARMELKPVGPGDSYYQPFALLSATLGEGNRLETIAPSASSSLAHSLAAGEEYYPLRFSANATARGDVVFVGFGIRAEDYGDAVKGKIALALDHEPGENDPNSPFDGLITSVASSQINKTLLAQRRGAIGILFVSDIHNHPGLQDFEAAARSFWPPEPPRIERWELADWVDQVRIPSAQISVRLAEHLVQPTGRALVDMARASEGPVGSARMAVPGAAVSLRVSVRRQTMMARNVLALIEGADPRLKDEWLIVSGHHDMNGFEGTQIQYGADDNASGVAGVLAIGEAFAQAAANGQRPKRSILFVSFDAEERGPVSLGAWAYTERPLNPLAKTLAIINFDLIGRDEEVPENGGPKFRGLPVQTAASNVNSINVLGLTRFPGLRAPIDAANRPFGLKIKADYDNNPSQLMRRSDQWPFINRGVPGLWFLTGLHPDYHTTNDRPERLNYPKMERIVRMTHQLLWQLANEGITPAR